MADTLYLATRRLIAGGNDLESPMIDCRVSQGLGKQPCRVARKTLRSRDALLCAIKIEALVTHSGGTYA
jgi:hypothetical protein